MYFLGSLINPKHLMRSESEVMPGELLYKVLRWRERRQFIGSTMLSYVAASAGRGSCPSVLACRTGKRRLYSLFDHLPTNTTQPPVATTGIQRKESQNSSPFDVLSSKTKIPSQDSPQQKSKQPSSSAGTDAPLFNVFHPKNQANLAAQTRARRSILEQPTMERLEREIQGLHQLASSLAPKPLLSDAPATKDEDAKERKELFERTKCLMAVLEQATEQKIINPSGKHGRSVSAILAKIMSIYSASHHREEEQSAFEECLYALYFLDSWNLDRQETHYQYSILTAVHEQRWQDASDLFLQQIDREISGFCPVKVSVASPVGLYAIAKAAQEKGSSAVETVLEAVTSLSLISPTEQDQCR